MEPINSSNSNINDQFIRALELYGITHSAKNDAEAVDKLSGFIWENKANLFKCAAIDFTNAQNAVQRQKISTFSMTIMKKFEGNA